MSDINPDLLPVRLDPAAASFRANGHTYTVDREMRLSIARDRWLEKFGLYALLGRDAMSLLKEVRRAYDALNASKPLDAGVVLDNIMKGAADLSAKEAPLLYICTLFINREGEDRRSYDLELGKQKIADWEVAGFERDVFMSWGLNFLSITGEELTQLFRNFSGVKLPETTLNEPNLSGNKS